ncbi:hypothetical protein AVEN_134667-1 [Araneus ventricosus]|uniref:Uncharacterized protein n=1 Tax=Araneus ventricosus TaxID=182803 RepID=A0A4Y2F5L2_ARAVE|nr:hypothetical protein AVEN_134667-1 [Araneus ventricosus]
MAKATYKLIGINNIENPLRGSLIRASTGSGDPEVPELPSARGYILASELSQSSTFGAPVFDHRSCPFSPSMSDSPLDSHAASVVAQSKGSWT